MNDELKENDTKAKTSGFVQKIAGGIAFLITIAVTAVVFILIAWIEPLGKILYSDENAQTTTRVIIIVSFVAMWFLRAWLRKPRNPE
jgi:uncharacterized BrkB/YihY/UPF0761 family membrane protein